MPLAHRSRASSRFQLLILMANFSQLSSPGCLVKRKELHQLMITPSSSRTKAMHMPLPSSCKPRQYLPRSFKCLIQLEGISVQAQCGEGARCRLKTGICRGREGEHQGDLGRNGHRLEGGCVVFNTKVGKDHSLAVLPANYDYDWA